MNPRHIYDLVRARQQHLLIMTANLYSAGSNGGGQGQDNSILRRLSMKSIKPITNNEQQNSSRQSRSVIGNAVRRLSIALIEKKIQILIVLILSYHRKAVADKQYLKIVTLKLV